MANQVEKINAIAITDIENLNGKTDANIEKFNGKEFLLSCDDGQEEHLEELLIQINQKFNDLKMK